MDIDDAKSLARLYAKAADHNRYHGNYSDILHPVAELIAGRSGYNFDVTPLIKRMAGDSDRTLVVYTNKYKQAYSEERQKKRDEDAQCPPDPADADTRPELPEGRWWWGNDGVDGPEQIHRFDIWRDDPEADTYVCEQIEVVARTVDESGAGNGWLIEFYIGDGDERQARTAVITEGDLAGEGAALFKRLGDAGLAISRRAGAWSDFRQLLQAWYVETRVTMHARPGWHGDVYVSPTGEVLGSEADGDASEHDVPASILSPAVVLPGPARAGTFEDWRREVAEPCWSSGGLPQLALGMLIGGAGPVLQLVGRDLVESFGVSLCGQSQRGKTTSQIVGASLTSDPTPKPDAALIITATTDDQKIAAHFRRGHGGCVHFDDWSARIGRGLERFGYGATNQACGLYTISTERTLEELVGADIKDGLRGRLLEFDVSGIPPADPQRVEAIRRAALRNYGWAMPKIIDRLIGDGLRADVECLRADVMATAKELYGADPDPVRWRFAKQVALLETTGVLMLDAGVISGTPADVRRVTGFLWQRLEQARASKQVLHARLLDWLLSERDPHVQMMDKPAASGDVWAWADTRTGVAYIRSDKIDDIGNSVPGVRGRRKDIVDGLKTAGVLITPDDSGGGQTWPHVPVVGKRCRHYRVKL